MKTEVKVGIFVAIGLLFLFLLSTQVNKFANIGKKGYEIYALLDDASGLEKNAKVKIKGVDAGFVKSLTLDGIRVKAKLFIYQGVKVPLDSIVILQQESLLGTKYIAIQPGKAKEYLKPNDLLKRQKIYADFSQTSDAIAQAAVEFKKLTKELRRSIAGSSGEDLKESIENLRALTANLKELIRKNSDNITKSIENIKMMGEKLSNAGEKFGVMSDKFAYTANQINRKLPDILERIDDITLALKDTSKDIKTKLPTLMDKFVRLEDDLQDVVEKNKEPLSKAIKSADTFFTTGGSSFKKLDKFLSAVGKSRLAVNFRGLYMSNDAYNKGSFGIDYIPLPNKHYILEVVSADDYSKQDANGNFILPSKHEKSKYYINAQYARRYGNLQFRLGMIETTAGLGVDYYLFNDHGKLSLDAYDFNAVNDIRGDNAHLTLLYRYRFLKHIDLYLGGDNLLNSKARNVMVGLGLHFIDNDMKYLLGTASGAGSFIK